MTLHYKTLWFPRKIFSKTPISKEEFDLSAKEMPLLRDSTALHRRPVATVLDPCQIPHQRSNKMRKGTMSAFALPPRLPSLLSPSTNRGLFRSPLRHHLRRTPPQPHIRRASPPVSLARRQRIDPRDEAFVTCTSCGSDEITSAESIIRNGTAVVTCTQCRNTWTARADDALTITGAPLVNHEGGGAGGNGEMEEEVARNMGVKLFVGGLGPKVDSDALRAALEEFGEVREAKVVYDRVTGRSRGFGFVTVVGKSAASAAMDVLSDSSTALGRRLKIREAMD